MKTYRFIWIAASVILYANSLSGTAFHYLDGGNGPDGLSLLGIGYFGPMVGVFAWYANPLLALSWLFSALNGHRIALYMSFAALLLGLSALLMHDFRLPDNNGGMVGSFTGYFWLWIASMAVMLPGSFALTPPP